MKLGEQDHPRGRHSASALGGVGGIGGISFLIGEDKGFLVIQCVSLSYGRRE